VSGFVYLIGSTNFQWYKIGKSKKPVLRVQDIGILLPFKVEIFAVWQAKNHTLLEQTLHEMFSVQRINGEWFQFNPKEIKKLVYETIPADTRIFPSNEVIDAAFNAFSNLDEDVAEYKVRKKMSDEERERRKQESLAAKVVKRAFGRRCPTCNHSISLSTVLTEAK